MNLVFENQALADLQHWVRHDRKMCEKILVLIEHIKRDPRTGVGKPEKLRENFSGLWSRRITQEHRVVYKITEETIAILSCRYHYKK